MTKLTPLQQRVLDRLNEGWEYCHSTSAWQGGDWLQEKGCGKGGKTEHVRGGTLTKLRKLGLVRHLRGNFPAQSWGLKE